MPSRRNVVIGLCAFGLGTGLARGAMAKPPIVTKDGFAIGGYDSAAYWAAKKATMGTPAVTFEWQSANWLFSSQAHRDLFAANPTKHAPAFNGYCPFCLAGNKVVPGVGNFWDIHDGKLYLLLNERIRDEFMMKARYYVERADAYWAKLP